MENDLFRQMAEIIAPDVSINAQDLISKAESEASRIGAAKHPFLCGYYESKIKILCTLVNAYGSKELKNKIKSVI